MTINESELTKGQTRKLISLRTSLGKKIADSAFKQWIKATPKKPKSKNTSDPVSMALIAAVERFNDDKSFNLGSKGYVVKRSKGKGASGFVAQKVV